mmetsp:Transcript_79180/g.203964  ORF Transcript_79180/g.203964 Transcript_79180/m.203964 type:complete len:231 (+) Transcript_79180:1144-1836(+)
MRVRPRSTPAQPWRRPRRILPPCRGPASPGRRAWCIPGTGSPASSAPAAPRCGPCRGQRPPRLLPRDAGPPQRPRGRQGPWYAAASACRPPPRWMPRSSTIAEVTPRSAASLKVCCPRLPRALPAMPGQCQAGHGRRAPGLPGPAGGASACGTPPAWQPAAACARPRPCSAAPRGLSSASSSPPTCCSPLTPFQPAGLGTSAASPGDPHLPGDCSLVQRRRHRHRQQASS